MKLFLNVPPTASREGTVLGFGLIAVPSDARADTDQVWSSLHLLEVIYKRTEATRDTWQLSHLTSPTDDKFQQSDLSLEQISRAV
ncbi:hypothetical protein J6590_008959 [Homalodisca vitripennis]|nr:hypothetical protein J6590_008959 [Homalodisca vitripennis]